MVVKFSVIYLMFSFGGFVGLVVRAVVANIFDDLLFQKDIFAPTMGKEFTFPTHSHWWLFQSYFINAVFIHQYLLMNGFIIT